MSSRLLQVQSRRQLGTFAGLIALCLILWAATPHFLTVSNLLNVLEQTAINAIVAVGMTFVIISGGIDLSVGSIYALAGVGMGLKPPPSTLLHAPGKSVYTRNCGK